MPEPIHAVIRKVNAGNREDGTPSYVHLMFFPDVLTTQNAEWIPAEYSGSSAFRLDAYADTVALDFTCPEDCTEYIRLCDGAKSYLHFALIDGAFPHDWEALKNHPISFHLKWEGGAE